MKMGIPQILIIVLYALSLGITLAKNGQPKDENHNIGLSLVFTIIVFSILFAGGFFN